MRKSSAVPATLLWRRNLIHGAFNALSRVGHLAADIRAARSAVEIRRDVAYGEHPVAHRLDIYRPRFAARPLPVLLYIHGGAFVLCSKETHAAFALLNAAHAEYLVFNINYRLAPGHPYPAAIEDACAAYRWVVRHCRRYGGDPTRIVVAGESAGGNLALGVAIAATYERPEPYARSVFEMNQPPLAVMPVMPYLQVSEPQRRAGCEAAGYFALAAARDIALSYLGDAPRASAANLMADPIRILEQGRPPRRAFPRVFTGVGTADMCCSDVRRLESACRKLGIPVSAFYYDKERHAFHALRWRDAARRFWLETIGFLRQLAVAAPPAPIPPRPLRGWAQRRRSKRKPQPATGGQGPRRSLWAWWLATTGGGDGLQPRHATPLTPPVPEPER